MSRRVALIVAGSASALAFALRSRAGLRATADRCLSLLAPPGRAVAIAHERGGPVTEDWALGDYPALPEGFVMGVDVFHRPDLTATYVIDAAGKIEEISTRAGVYNLPEGATLAREAAR